MAPVESESWCSVVVEMGDDVVDAAVVVTGNMDVDVADDVGETDEDEDEDEENSGGAASPGLSPKLAFAAKAFW